MKRSFRFSLLLGNFLEHYDTALFSFLSPLLANLLFPGKDPLSALILTYALFPLSMLAKPVGSILFGYIGDVYGRKEALFFSLLGMAIVSTGIACIPFFSFAPLLFCLGKALQNFFSSGEVIGGAIFLLEESKEDQQDLLSSLFSFSAMIGHLLASLGAFCISHYSIIDPGWRILYLFGSLTAWTALSLRKHRKFPERSNERPHLFLHRKPLLSLILCSGFASSTYCMAMILITGLIPLINPLTQKDLLQMNTYLLIFDSLMFPLFGYLSSKISREKVMLFSSLGIIFFSIPLFSRLPFASLTEIVSIRLLFILFGVAFFAPFHAWAKTLIPSSSRYTVISFGYAVGTQLLGSPTGFIALWTYQKTGLISSLCWYWILLGIASTFAILLTKKTRKIGILSS